MTTTPTSLEMDPTSSTTAPNGKGLNNSPQTIQSSAQARLPTELLQDIFSYLSPRDYESARLVCQRWYAASLCKPLLLNLLATMKFDPFNTGCPCFDKPPFYTSTPPTTSCPDTCPCNYQFPESPIETWNLRSLRVAFALALDKHASSVRVACGKLVLDMSTFLKNVNTDWGYSEAPREVESLSFSEKSGSFVATVTRATIKDGRVERKLWIHRLFTSRHSPFNKIARPDDGFLFFVEGSRHLPGQLYLTVKLSKFPNIPVVSLRVEEHSAFSAVRKIVVRYINGKEEEIAFNKFKPDIQNPANGRQDDGTVFYDRKGITYRSSQVPWAVKQKAKGKSRGIGTGVPKPKGWGLGSVPIWKKDLAFRKDIAIYEDPLQKRTAVRTSQRILATIGDELLHQMCFRVTLPVSSSENEYSSIIITPNSDILVCAPPLGNPDQSPEIVHARYKFQVPPRASEPVGPRITHLTVAPQYKYDIGSGFWWMAVCAAYDNGEIWMWRVDIEVLQNSTGSIPSARTDEPTLIRAPARAATISKNRSCYPISRQSNGGGGGEPSTSQRNPGDFDPEIGECIAVDLCSFSGRTLSEGSMTRKVKVVLPPTEELGYMRPLKLGYMPGLEALNFVGRGRTVMAGTKKEIVVWDMRMWNGFERGKLKAEF